MQLFNRSTNPISLTEAGKYYIEQTEKILEIENNMKEHFSELLKDAHDSLNIGSSMFFCSYILPDIVDAFRERHPNLTITLSEGGSSIISEKIIRGEVDFLLETESLDKTVFESVPWRTEKIVLAVPAQLNLNEKLINFRYTFDELQNDDYAEPTKPVIDPAVFQNEYFLLLKKGNDIHNRSLSICKEAGFVPKVSIYVEQMMTAYYLVCENKGLAFLRSTILHCIPSTDKVFFYRLGVPKAERYIYLSYKKNFALSQIQQDFVDFMIQSE